MYLDMCLLSVKAQKQTTATPGPPSATCSLGRLTEDSLQPGSPTVQLCCSPSLPSHPHRGKADTEATWKRTNMCGRGKSSQQWALRANCATCAPVPSLITTYILPTWARGTALPQVETKCFLILRLQDNESNSAASDTF